MLSFSNTHGYQLDESNILFVDQLFFGTRPPKVVLRVIVVLPPKLVDIKKEFTAVKSNARSSTEEYKELHFDDETGEDNKIGTTKVFY